MERGIFTSSSEESFKSEEEIREEALEETTGRIPKIVKHYEVPHTKGMEEWFDEIERRSNFRKEIEGTSEYAKIEIESDKPVVIGLSGDWHLDGNIDKDMLRLDLDIMANHPLVVGSFLLGDLLDAANFNPAQDESILNFEEQRQALMSILDSIGKKRILGMWKGNHDHKWERKHGTSKYAGLSERYECPIFYGDSYLDLDINGINYKLLGSHRKRGSSVYTNAHPSVAGHRQVQGVDIVFCGHTHRRGYVEQPVREFRGSRMTYSIVSGTYQHDSEYTKDSGFGTQQGAELGMYWLILNHDRKLTRVCGTAEMLETVEGYL